MFCRDHWLTVKGLHHVEAEGKKIKHDPIELTEAQDHNNGNRSRAANNKTSELFLEIH